MYIGGSAAGNKVPSDPGKEWESIIDIGKEDLNLKAFWKPYELSDSLEEWTLGIGLPGWSDTASEYMYRNSSTSFHNDNNNHNANVSDQTTPDDWNISDGKNTFVSIVALRGIDGRKPIVDADADEDTADGREGDAKAPSVRAEKGGVVLACFIYDDPHVATVEEDGFDMLLSDSPGGDGMAIAIAPTDSNGRTDIIKARGRNEERGGGDDIAMTISLRAGDPVPIPTDSPTTSPTIAPKSTCNTAEEIACRDHCYVDNNCGTDRRSPCHRICRFGCCKDSPSTGDHRACFTAEQKICRENCFSRSCSYGDDLTVNECKIDCRKECCHGIP
jgi:hypothetical protein